MSPHLGKLSCLEVLERLGIQRLDLLHHLLECRLCRVHMRPVLAEYRVVTSTDSEARDPNYDAMWERLEANVLGTAGRRRREERRAVARLAELLALPEAERQKALASKRFHSWRLVSHLLEAGRTAGREDPAAGLERINLALALVDHLDPEGTGAGPAAGLVARAHSYLGESLALSGDPAGAEAAFQHAALHLEGSADPLDRAWFCHLLARMRAEEGRRDEAAALAGYAATLFVRVGQLPEAALALLDEIRLLRELLDPELALEPLHRMARLSQLGLLALHPADPPDDLAPLRARFAAVIETGDLDLVRLEQLLADLLQGG